MTVQTKKNVLNALYCANLGLSLQAYARAAMRQIDPKKYAKKYALEDIRVMKVAINFDLESRNLTDWLIEQA